MAHGSYLLKRDSRFYLQVRISGFWGKLTGSKLYRRSLQTSDPKQARIALTPYLEWIWPMMGVTELAGLFDSLTNQMALYVDDVSGPDPVKLRARESYEEHVRTCLNRVKHEHGQKVQVLMCPELNQTFDAFIKKNIAQRDWLDARIVIDSQAYVSIHQSPCSSVTNAADAAQPDIICHGEALRSERARDGAFPQSINHNAGVSNDIDTTVAVNSNPVPHIAAEQIAPTDDTDELDLTITEAMELCLASEKIKKKDDRQRAIAQPVVRFMIHQWGDIKVSQITPEMIKEFGQLLPLLPHRNAVPLAIRDDFGKRFDYGQQLIDQKQADGTLTSIRRIEQLERLTVTTITGGHFVGIRLFFNFIKQHELIEWNHDVPTLSVANEDVMAPLPRDAFRDDELLEIISLPLFTGCRSAQRFWTPGNYFVQSGVYWGYLIALLAGLRQSEIVKLDCSDVVERDDIWYFDLREFDPDKGRIALKDLKKFKASGSKRIVPVHPLLIALGLLERKEALEGLGCKRLFPELVPYEKKDGRIDYGRPLVKSYQYIKKKFGQKRPNVSLYSMRHAFADALDNLVGEGNLRDRVMGHKGVGVGPRYGAKSRLSATQAKLLDDLEIGPLKTLSKILLDALMKAENEELTMLKPWLQRANWKDIDCR